jgi:hypothetical protein
MLLHGDNYSTANGRTKIVATFQGSFGFFFFGTLGNFYISLPRFLTVPLNSVLRKPLILLMTS